MSNNAPRDAEYYLAELNALKNSVMQWSQGAVTDNNAGSIRDLIGKIKDLAKNAEKDRKAIKEPYLEQGRKVDNQFKPVSTTADSLVAPLNKMLTDYLRAEDERKRREAEEARKRAEAEAKAAEALKGDECVGADAQARAEQAAKDAKEAATAAEKTNVAGFESDRALGLRTYRKAKVTNAAMLVGHFANHPEVIALCEKLANAQIRAAKGGGVSIPGIEIVEDKKVA